MSQQKFPHYWICEACAKSKGGIFPYGHVCTAIIGECKYCGNTDILIPWVDFDWPNDKSKNTSAKLFRD